MDRLYQTPFLQYESDSEPEAFLVGLGYVILRYNMFSLTFCDACGFRVFGLQACKSPTREIV